MDTILVTAEKPVNLNCKIGTPIPPFTAYFPASITKEMIEEGVGYFVPQESEFTARIAKGPLKVMERTPENIKKVVSYWKAKKGGKGKAFVQAGFLQLQIAQEILQSFKIKEGAE